MAFEPLTYQTWRDRRAAAESCPWAGPRPLREADAFQFVGRTKDVEDFLNDVLENSLVVLEAESGVGKSSLLRAGLIGELRAEGYEPFYCDRWAASADSLSPDDHLRTVFDGVVPSRPDEPFILAVNRQFGSRAVLILDQFEELIRYNEKFFRDVASWIAEVVSEHDVKIVISLRSEYSHQLRDLERQIGPWGMSRCILRPVSDEADIRELLRAPPRTDSQHGALDTEAEELILALWGEHELGASPTGLLRLHSLLYALHGRLQEGMTTISSDTVASLLAESGHAVFDAAMAETVRLKMKLCEDALGDAGESDSFLRHGTRRVVQEVVRHLSSGGYKLAREEWDLAQRALDRELAVLQSGSTMQLETSLGSPEAIFRCLSELASAEPDKASVDFLTAPWDRIVPASRLDVMLVQSQPWEIDPDELSSGAMLAMHPGLVLIEEFRRFTFALKWLEDSSLIRMTDADVNRAMVSLVHDGFGVALEAWVDELVGQPADAVSRLTASKGEVFNWLREDETHWLDLDGSEIINLRWRDCVIRGKFRHVTFVNCDFRGSRFEHCRFEGVQFLNCVLDRVTISESEVAGGVSTFTEEYPDGVPPSFVVAPSAEGAVEVLLRYRGARNVDDPPRELISHTSGMPAVPFTRDHKDVFPKERTDWKPWTIPWPAASGGFAMYGGRLCSLMVRRCQFTDEGAVALRLVSGTALDIVECTEGRVRLDVYGSAIRGLTITGSAGETESPVAVESVVTDAVMAETWLGSGLTGSARFKEALIWQLLSLASRDDFVTEFSDCGFFGLINVAPPEDGTSLAEQFRLDALEEPDEKAAIAARMDYQSDPAREEYERRERAQTRVWPRLGAVEVHDSPRRAGP